MPGDLVVFTGAGISAESGLATFRDKRGLWHDTRISEVCDYLTWKHHFEKVHAFYNQRRLDIAEAKPNVAHEYLADWQKRYSTVMLTQNIDDLLERAGCGTVIHLHGRATEMVCEACGNRWDIGLTAWDPETQRCPKCSSRKSVKPGVVFFNEMAPQYAVLNRVIRDLSPDDIVVVMGTSGQVINIGSMMERRPGFKVLNNLARSESPLSRDIEDSVYHECFFEPATTAVQRIDELLRERLG